MTEKKKAWQKPEVRQLDLSDEVLKKLFGENRIADEGGQIRDAAHR